MKKSGLRSGAIFNKIINKNDSTSKLNQDVYGCYRCYVPYCTAEGSKLKLFNFPKDQIRCHTWLQLIGRNNVNLKDVDKLTICDLHFSNSMWNYDGNSRCLSNAAVPDINLNLSEEPEILVLQDKPIANKLLLMGSKRTASSSAINSIPWIPNDDSISNSSLYRLPALSSLSSSESNSFQTPEILRAENERLQSTVDSNMSYILNQKKHYESLLKQSRDKLVFSQKESDNLRASHNTSVENYEHQLLDLKMELHDLKNGPRDKSEKYSDSTMKKFKQFQDIICELKSKGLKLKDANTELSKANDELVDMVTKQESSHRSLNDVFYKLSSQETNFKLLIESILQREDKLKAIVKRLKKKVAKYKKHNRSPSFLIRLADKYLTRVQVQLLKEQISSSIKKCPGGNSRESDESEGISDLDDSNTPCSPVFEDKLQNTIDKEEFHSLCAIIYKSSPDLYATLHTILSLPPRENILSRTNSIYNEDMRNILKKSILTNRSCNSPIRKKLRHDSNSHSEIEDEVNIWANIEESLDNGKTRDENEELIFSDSEPEFEKAEVEFSPNTISHKSESHIIHTLPPLNESQQVAEVTNVIQRTYFSMPPQSHIAQSTSNHQHHQPHPESPITEVPHRPYLRMSNHESQLKIRKDIHHLPVSNQHFAFPPDSHLVHASAFNPVHAETFDLAYSNAPIGTRVDLCPSMPMLIQEDPSPLHVRQQIPLVVSSMGQNQTIIPNVVSKYTEIDESQHMNPSGSKMVFRVLQ